MNYIDPSHSFVIVKELTKDMIEEAVNAYAEEDKRYWLKSNHFAGDIPKSVFNKLQA